MASKFRNVSRLVNRITTGKFMHRCSFGYLFTLCVIYMPM
jgi:hypothetical protein